jgi:tetratricopeptide (TPR) repeat protein/predicted Ser/Thr protein kinase
VAVNTQGSLLDGRYRVVRHLGSGGMASVLLCKDERLARQVAVKRLHADSPVDVEQRFTREAKLGASLNHPNLVSVFDTATDDEGVLIVMEYVEGEPLSRMLRRGPLRPEEVASMVRDLGDALDHAHSQGVIHRDVKPANVLIREDGVTKLADLGIATASDGTRITRSGTVLGTAAYMAPEQLDGREAGPAADVYALAAISFEALSGKRPREGRTPMEIAHKIATEGAPDLLDAWPGAPRVAAEVLKRGMAQDPEDRPPSAGEFARELATALEAPPEEKPARTRRLGGRRRAKRTAAGAAVAGAAGAAAGAGAAGAAAAERADAAASARAAADPTPAPRHTRPAHGPPPPTQPPRSARRRGARSDRSRLGAIALAAVFIALAIATISGAVLSGGDDDGSSPSSADDRQAAEPAKPKAKKDEPKADNAPEADNAPKANNAPKEDTPAAPAPAEEPASTGSYDPTRGAALNDEGFILMNRGDYDGAIAKLQEAVDSFPPGTDDLNYAYALFNLGKSLRLAGRPDEAIPILEQRLQIPNQTDTVQRELDLAKQQAGEG